MTTGPAPQFHSRTPPINGAFPLDHDGECRPQVLAYLKCLKEASASFPRGSKQEPSPGVNVNPQKLESVVCASLARTYFECRLQSGLISEADWRILGLGEPPARATATNGQGGFDDDRSDH